MKYQTLPCKCLHYYLNTLKSILKLGKNNLIYICYLRVVGSSIQLYFVKHLYCHAMHWARTKGGNRRHLILMLWSIESRQGFEELRNPQNLQYRYMIQLLMRSCCLHNDKKSMHVCSNK